MLSGLSRWSHIGSSFISAMIPTCCALCARVNREVVCAGCHAQFFADLAHRCQRCALPLADHASFECGNCLKQAPAFDNSIVAASYAAPVDQLVLALKFGKRLELAPLFARMLSEAVQRTRQGKALPSVLTMVPLGKSRLEERGFNQAVEIARPLASALGIRLDMNILIRRRETRAQAMLPPSERRENVRGAFQVAPDAIRRIRGRHIGVVDDVMTTGETLHEIAATLKRCGARRVTNLVFARTAPF